MKNIYIGIAFLLVTSCGNTPAQDKAATIFITEAINLGDCNYHDIQGEEIVFKMKTLVGGIDNGYEDFSINENLTYKSEPKVKKYAFRHAKVRSGLVGALKRARQVIVDNCDVLYLDVHEDVSKGRYILRTTSEYNTKADFDEILKEIAEVKKLIGKSIWIGLEDNHYMHSYSGVPISLENYEEVKVIDVFGGLNTTGASPHSYDALSVLVRKSTGEEGYYPYSDGWPIFYPYRVVSTAVAKAPFEKNWSSKIITSIKRREVLIGMSGDQVRAAWGSPSSVNVTELKNLVHEQWVYKNGKYVYLRNDIVTGKQY